MGKKEKLQKEIDRLERYAKFYLNILLALLTGLTGIVYSIIVKQTTNVGLVAIGIAGVVVVVFVAIRIKKIDKNENELLKQLEKE